jgi:hypothetical protein
MMLGQTNIKQPPISKRLLYLNLEHRIKQKAGEYLI